MLQIIRESGRLNVGYYKFEIDDNKGASFKMKFDLYENENVSVRDSEEEFT